MKVIDLLNLDNKPQKIKYKNYIWIQPINMNIYVNEENIDFETYLASVQICDLGRTFNEVLNDEIEIIEDKPEKIEPIKMVSCNIEFKIGDEKTLLPTETMQYEIAVNKINEVIDKLNYLLEKSDKK